jgi:hypothetical protein
VCVLYIPHILQEFFETLTQLVAHYKRDADGLCHRLITPLPQNNADVGVDVPDATAHHVCVTTHTLTHTNIPVITNTVITKVSNGRGTQ